jgi:hypothetical protein
MINDICKIKKKIINSQQTDTKIPKQKSIYLNSILFTLTYVLKFFIFFCGAQEIIIKRKKQQHIRKYSQGSFCC